MRKYEGKMKKYVEIMKKYEEIFSLIQGSWDLRKLRTLPGVVADLWRHPGGGQRRFTIPREYLGLWGYGVPQKKDMKHVNII